MKVLMSLACLAVCVFLGMLICSTLFKVSMGVAFMCMLAAFFSQVFGALAVGILKS